MWHEDEVRASPAHNAISLPVHGESSIILALGSAGMGGLAQLPQIVVSQPLADTPPMSLFSRKPATVLVFQVGWTRLSNHSPVLLSRRPSSDEPSRRLPADLLTS